MNGITVSNTESGIEQWIIDPSMTVGNRVLVCPVCPDLLDHAALGVADNFRGRVVRGFFWLMRIWPT